MKMKSVIIITMLIVIIFSGVVLAADRVSLGFIYDSTDSIELVDRTNGSINQVSPTCLDLDSKGNLIVTSVLTHDFVKAMKEREILVTPFLSNHWIRSKGRAAINNADNLTDQIIAVIEEYDLDGVNVDIENLTPEDKDAFSEFVKILRNKMPSNKLLSVSVAANPEGKDSGWQGSYDYEKLGEYADYLFVMTYDEHSQGGECGPVASLEFVEASIKYALQYVSKDKIVMGIPLYGRYWKEGAKTGGEAVVIGAVPALISKNKGIVKYEPEIGEARVTFSIDNPIIKSRINGLVLENGNYTIWYPNEESIKLKLDLVNKYDLLGAGVWALGQEKVDVWEYYKNELNKIPYVSAEEIKIKEKYEALIVDMSNLEEPEILVFKYDANKEIEILQKNEEERKVSKEEKYDKNNKKDINYIEIQNTIQDEIWKLKKLSQKTLNKENIKLKENHIYRYCRKDILK